VLAESRLETSVEQVRNQHIRAVNAGDVEGATGLFAAEAVFLPPGQPALEGAAIRGWFTYVFANFRLAGFVIQPGGVERHGDVSIEHGSWNATFQPKNGSADRAAGGTYLTVYRHLADGSVRIIRDTFNDAPPA
jgi:ketosteroid isomerase-like protein